MNDGYLRIPAGWNRRRAVGRRLDNQDACERNANRTSRHNQLSVYRPFRNAINRSLTSPRSLPLRPVANPIQDVEPAQLRKRIL